MFGKMVFTIVSIGVFASQAAAGDISSFLTDAEETRIPYAEKSGILFIGQNDFEQYAESASHVEYLYKGMLEDTNIPYTLISNQGESAFLIADELVPLFDDTAEWRTPGWITDLDPTAPKSLSICGRSLKVPAFFYAACVASIYLLPASCTIGVAVTAGGACAATMTSLAVTCGVGANSMRDIGNSCIAGGY